jgi:hypothetical protein
LAVGPGMRVANFLGTQTPIQLTAFRAPVMTYFTDASTKGRVLFGQLPWVIGITEAPDKPLLVGTAMRRGSTEDGQAMWSLKVRGAEVPGRFIIIDGRFVEVEPGGEKTGQNVTQMIEQGGRFERACITYLAAGDAFLYHDRAGDDEAAKTRKKKAASKSKFTCPACDLNAWAKPEAFLVCGDCGEPMEAEPVDQDDE